MVTQDPRFEQTSHYLREWGACMNPCHMAYQRATNHAVISQHHKKVHPRISLVTNFFSVEISMVYLLLHSHLLIVHTWQVKTNTNPCTFIFTSLVSSIKPTLLHIFYTAATHIFVHTHTYNTASCLLQQRDKEEKKKIAAFFFIRWIQKSSWFSIVALFA